MSAPGAPLSGGLPPQPTHYQVLGLTRDILDEEREPAQLVRRAYRRALLRHHPDKTLASSASPSSRGAVITERAGDCHPLEPGAFATGNPSPGQNQQPARAGGGGSSTRALSIDQISTASAVLSDPRRRGEYDRILALLPGPPLTAPGSSGGSNTGGPFQTGIENVDLDDLSSTTTATTTSTTTQETIWYRGCRCGNERGFVLAESDLEEAADQGELVVGCQDCSLWLRVHFAVAEDD